MTWGALLHPLINMTAIVAGRYLMVSATLYALLWLKPERRTRAIRLSKRAPTAKQVRSEIVLSLTSSVIYAAPAALAMVAWQQGHTRMYSDLSPDAWPGMAASAIAYLLLHDAFYYWAHRLMHRRSLFAAFHAGHHRAHEPSPFAGFAFDPLEAVLTGWFLPALVFLIPMEVHMAVVMLLVVTVTGTINHGGWELMPRAWVEGPIGRWMVIPSHHSQHHTRFGCNFGLYFQLWDRLMGTNAEAANHPALRREAA